MSFPYTVFGTAPDRLPGVSTSDMAMWLDFDAYHRNIFQDVAQTNAALVDGDDIRTVSNLFTQSPSTSFDVVDTADPVLAFASTRSNGSGGSMRGIQHGRSFCFAPINSTGILRSNADIQVNGSFSFACVLRNFSPGGWIFSFANSNTSGSTGEGIQLSKNDGRLIQNDGTTNTIDTPKASTDNLWGTTDAFHVLSIQSNDSGVVEFWADGLVRSYATTAGVGGTQATTSGKLTLFADLNANGHGALAMAECMFYTTAIGRDNMERLHRYLGGKWGVDLRDPIKVL